MASDTAPKIAAIAMPLIGAAIGYEVSDRKPRFALAGAGLGLALALALWHANDPPSASTDIIYRFSGATPAGIDTTEALAAYLQSKGWKNVVVEGWDATQFSATGSLPLLGNVPPEFTAVTI
jgi:hypothetical protein